MLPLQLPASWIFRLMPFTAGPACLRARRHAILLLGVAPPWILSALVVLSAWRWKLAAIHLGVLALLGIAVAEFTPGSAQKLPFLCAYLPGKSKLHITFWFWLYLVLAGTIGMA